MEKRIRILYKLFNKLIFHLSPGFFKSFSIFEFLHIGVEWHVLRFKRDLRGFRRYLALMAL